MLNVFLPVAAGYLIVTGTTTSAALVGRGLISAAKTALGGDVRKATAEVCGGLMSPTLVTYAALAGLCAEAIGAAREVAAPVAEIDAVPFGRVA